MLTIRSKCLFEHCSMSAGSPALDFSVNVCYTIISYMIRPEVKSMALKSRPIYRNPKKR